MKIMSNCFGTGNSGYCVSRGDFSSSGGYNAGNNVGLTVSRNEPSTPTTTYSGKGSNNAKSENNNYDNTNHSCSNYTVTTSSTPSSKQVCKQFWENAKQSKGQRAQYKKEINKLNLSTLVTVCDAQQYITKYDILINHYKSAAVHKPKNAVKYKNGWYNTVIKHANNYELQKQALEKHIIMLKQTTPPNLSLNDFATMTDKLNLNQKYTSDKYKQILAVAPDCDIVKYRETLWRDCVGTCKEFIEDSIVEHLASSIINHGVARSAGGIIDTLVIADIIKCAKNKEFEYYKRCGTFPEGNPYFRH